MKKSVFIIGGVCLLIGAKVISKLRTMTCPKCGGSGTVHVTFFPTDTTVGDYTHDCTTCSGRGIL